MALREGELVPVIQKKNLSWKKNVFHLVNVRYTGAKHFGSKWFRGFEISLPLPLQISTS